MEKIISHVADKEETIRLLSVDTTKNKALKQLALEFCHAFDVRVGLPRLLTEPFQHSAHIEPWVFTPEGVPCGRISVSGNGSDMYYKYTSPVIQKEKASARSDKNSRDSSKISGLITAIKRNDEHPDAKSAMRCASATDAVRYALSSINDERRFRMDVPTEAVTELVKAFLSQPNSVEGYRSQIEEAHALYVASAESYNDKRLAQRRFLEGGFKVVFINELLSTAKSVIILADGTATSPDNNHISLTNFRGVSDLSDMPDLQAVAMMTRAYLQGKGNSVSNNNPFGVNRVDIYYDEIDIASGYARGDMLALLIPNKAP